MWAWTVYLRAPVVIGLYAGMLLASRPRVERTRVWAHAHRATLSLTRVHA